MNQPPSTSAAPPAPPAQPLPQSGTTAAASAIAPPSFLPTSTIVLPSTTVAAPIPFYPPPRASIAITNFTKYDKLSADHNNWLAWKTRIVAILKRKKTYGIATGDIPRPSGPETDPAVVEWIELDLAATEQILVGLTDEEVNHVVTCRTAAEIWSTLCTIHEPTHVQIGQFSVGSLWHKQATDDTDVTEHLNELTHTRNLLASQGKDVSDSDFRSVMLETLPLSWNPFISSLLGQANTKTMTITQLKSTLSEEYQCLQRLKRESEADATAYPASLSRTKKRKGVCAICERRNHATKDCRWFGKNAPKCDICGKIGHDVDKCWRNPTNKGKGRINKA